MEMGGNSASKAISSHVHIYTRISYFHEAILYIMFYACRKLVLWLVITALPHLGVDIDYVLG
jgi:hypothetical protein